jgi:putative FmdB family regulatory protein
MPTYEYECTNGHHFEVEQSIKDPALKRCKVCRAKAHRLISASHFILKGSGWYADGYGSAKPKAKSGESGSESKPSSESKSESKTSESKTETKPAKSGGEKSSGSSKPGSGSAASAGS